MIIYYEEKSQPLSFLNKYSKYSKMKQEQEKSIRTVKLIANNVLEVEVYYSSLNLLYM
ncbi:Uncharacterised protein [Streptococcus pneumoniae]|nr:Uncharacterised protein [Streptococcus pneumoniae]CIS64629.1 Uncharacterised protein [Streptococcus pneumoniae]CIT70617.1 Uncharacterised protein [Streptococcus pneumoniae]CIV30632.1 Uncharacterised protein [Streptococcus pneumoniae]CKL46670.1 Uncharacterised protein [Streptococcus pneumoniae]